jgi:hypothetical protein
MVKVEMTRTKSRYDKTCRIFDDIGDVLPDAIYKPEIRVNAQGDYQNHVTWFLFEKGKPVFHFSLFNSIPAEKKEPQRAMAKIWMQIFTNPRSREDAERYLMILVKEVLDERDDFNEIVEEAKREARGGS